MTQSALVKSTAKSTLICDHELGSIRIAGWPFTLSDASGLYPFVPDVSASFVEISSMYIDISYTMVIERMQEELCFVQAQVRHQQQQSVDAQFLRGGCSGLFSKVVIICFCGQHNT